MRLYRDIPTRIIRTKRALSTAVLLMVGLSACAVDTAPTDLVTIEGLGSLSFPNTGSAEAQSDFLRGVLLLHSFEYEFAAEAFQAAQEIDPDFALAYWGEAMTHTHPVWNQKDVDAARAALDRFGPDPEARAAKVKTDRERMYLTAVERLYGEGDKVWLDQVYSDNMAELAAAYPDDAEAQLFYALSLLGLSQGDRDVPTYIEAGTIALKAFEGNSGHPGAAHYTIHAFDDPTHAILAMDAARAYGPMAPAAGHAQHMTTHIFLARGMWDDVVTANVRADAVTDRNLADAELPPTFCGHYNEWLLYGYQQQGRRAEALALLDGCLEQSRDERLTEERRASAAGSYFYMRGLYLADTEDWSGSEALTSMEAWPVYQLIDAWGRGMEALGEGDLSAAIQHHQTLLDGSGSLEASFLSPYAPIWTGTLGALIAAESGDLNRALELAHEAAEYEAALPVDFGPPISFKPAREVEAEVLMRLDRPDQAFSTFQMALERTPNRMRSLIGAARAADAAGMSEAAAVTYRAVAELLEGADAGSPELREAQAYLASEVDQ